MASQSSTHLCCDNLEFVDSPQMELQICLAILPSTFEDAAARIGTSPVLRSDGSTLLSAISERLLVTFYIVVHHRRMYEMQLRCGITSRLHMTVFHFQLNWSEISMRGQTHQVSRPCASF